MEIQFADDFDAIKIAQSGQCFRWYPLADNRCRIFAGAHTVVLSQPAPNCLELTCTQAEFDDLWHTYFDFNCNYTELRSKILPADSYLTQAAEYGRGIRILRQDPWEMLITFLLSQRKSIPAIRKSVEALCTAAGTPIGEEQGQILYAFPTPSQLAALEPDTLASCGLGYRLPYVQRAAQFVCQNPAQFASFSQQSDAELLQSLLAFHGVGAKIAHCVMLFGFHRLDAFPKDVWINRVLDTHYPNGYPFAQYAPFNGVMQQYLFFFGRAEHHAFL